MAENKIHIGGGADAVKSTIVDGGATLKAAMDTIIQELYDAKEIDD